MSASSAQAIGVVGAGGPRHRRWRPRFSARGWTSRFSRRATGSGGVGATTRTATARRATRCLWPTRASCACRSLAERSGGPLWQYASHSEMRGYFESIADSEGLRPHLRLGWRVATANHADGAWTLRSANGEERRYLRADLCARGQWPASLGISHGRLFRRAAPQCRVSNPGALHGPRRRRHRARERPGMEIAGELAEHARSVVVAVQNANVGDDAAARQLPDRLVRESDGLDPVLPWSPRTPSDRESVHADDRRVAPPRAPTPDSSLRGRHHRDLGHVPPCGPARTHRCPAGDRPSRGRRGPLHGRKYHQSGRDCPRDGV